MDALVRSSHFGLWQVMWITIAFISTAAFFVGLTLATLRHQRWARRLPGLEALPAPAELDGVPTSAVRCSVIVAARDEEARLEATVRHLLAQRDVTLEVIVVDDRSSDATGDILRRLASEDTRVRATRVEHLPEGWLGKSHACHVGASAATGGRRISASTPATARGHNTFEKKASRRARTMTARIRRAIEPRKANRARAERTTRRWLSVRTGVVGSAGTGV